MGVLKDLRPSTKPRIMDLVAKAGLDISDWERSKGKAKTAAMNPKYCYEWAFLEPGRLALLNLWYDDLKERKGKIFTTVNQRQFSKRVSGTVKARARRMDHALDNAFENSLPVRVILLSGKRRNRNLPESEASKVTARLLDECIWHVAKYDKSNGDCRIERGPGSIAFVDQFDVVDEYEVPVNKVSAAATVYLRNPEIRRRVRDRAQGRCELCGEPGFMMRNGGLYLETHHIVPLSEGGPDSTTNVIALCPNHHRQAHYGSDWVSLRKALSSRISVKHK